MRNFHRFALSLMRSHKLAMVAFLSFYLYPAHTNARDTGDPLNSEFAKRFIAAENVNEANQILDNYLATLKAPIREMSVPDDLYEAIDNFQGSPRVKAQAIRRLPIFKADDRQKALLVRAMEVTPLLLSSRKTIDEIANVYTDVILDPRIPHDTKLAIAEKSRKLRQPSARFAMQSLSKLKDSTVLREQEIYNMILRSLADKSRRKYWDSEKKFAGIFEFNLRRSWLDLDKASRHKIMEDMLALLKNKSASEKDRRGARRFLQGIVNIEITKEYISDLTKIKNCSDPALERSGIDPNFLNAISDILAFSSGELETPNLSDENISKVENSVRITMTVMSSHERAGSRTTSLEIAAQCNTPSGESELIASERVIGNSISIKSEEIFIQQTPPSKHDQGTKAN